MEILGNQLIAAHPGPAMHLALLGAVVVIGLVVFALARSRKRHAETIDELNMRALSTDQADPSRPVEQEREPAEEYGPPAEQRGTPSRQDHHARPH